jgi:hypothetical protein
MTTKEFSNEFDILFNSIATNAAPDIDEYEKSVYLTKAQKQLVKNYFNPKGNKYQDGFENSTKRRYDLSQLIKSYHSVFKTQINESFIQYAISNDSKFFKIPSNVFLILQESATLKHETDKCINNKKVSVTPSTHDEFNLDKHNPFKKPYKKKVIRMDYNTENLDYKIVELINPYNIKEYKIRYVKEPSPIILVNFNDVFPGEGLSIDSINIKTECKLNHMIHDEILDRAVELALGDYRPELLQVKSQLNSRNE